MRNALISFIAHFMHASTCTFLSKMVMIFASLIFSSISSAATIVVEADPDLPVRINASIDNPNRLIIQDGRLDLATGGEDKVTLEPDLDVGELRFKPRSKKPFSFFIRSESGITYTVIVTPKEDIVGQTITVVESALSTAHEYDRDVKVMGFKEQINHLLKELEKTRGATRLRGFHLNAVNRVVRLWRETDILHALTWKRGGMVIDRYVITNTSDATLSLDEREFRSLSEDIRAISIRDQVLQPAKSTVLYTFREAS